MYNRYTPQSDGSYKRDRMPEPPRPAPPPPGTDFPPPPPDFTRPPPEETHCAPPPVPAGKKEGLLGFLRQLLPRDFDTGDLLIILLLLLMAGDKEEDRNNALLTLALYIFM